MTENHIVGAARGLELRRGAGRWVLPLCLLLSVLAAVAIWSGLLTAGAVGMVTLAVVVGLGGWLATRSFATFIAVVIVIRPLVDLTAEPRGDDVGATALFGAAVLGVSLIWLWVNRVSLGTRVGSPAHLALLALTAALLLSAFGSASPAVSVPLVLRVLSGVVMYLVVDLLLATRGMTLRQVVAMIGASAVVPLLFPALGLLGVTVMHEKDGVAALKSVFYLSNNFAHFLVPLLLVATAWALHLRGAVRLLLLGVLGLGLAELLLTQTRGAWLALGVGLVALGVFISRRLLAAVLVAAVLGVLLVPSVQARFASLIPDPDQPRTESSLAWRFGHWGAILPSATASPVTGIGPGISQQAATDGKEPHNDYLRAYVETGVVGLTAYVALMAVAVLTGTAAMDRWGIGWGRLRRRSRPAHRADEVRADELVGLTMAALTAYLLAVALASWGENLIDNVTFLWSAMPCLAVLNWARMAPMTELRLAPTAEEPRGALSWIVRR